jgi:hypothetical protein
MRVPSGDHSASPAKSPPFVIGRACDQSIRATHPRDGSSRPVSKAIRLPSGAHVGAKLPSSDAGSFGKPVRGGSTGSSPEGRTEGRLAVICSERNLRSVWRHRGIRIESAPACESLYSAISYANAPGSGPTRRRSRVRVPSLDEFAAIAERWASGRMAAASFCRTAPSAPAASSRPTLPRSGSRVLSPSLRKVRVGVAVG